jgi:signal transduction histidine kinase
MQLAATSLQLRVSDNGRGLEATASRSAPTLGVGIPGMQARIRQFGGVLDIDSNDRGTTVRASIPLPEPES